MKNKNQCDGCAEGMKLVRGVHVKEDRYFGEVPHMVCTNGLYDGDQKSPETICPREKLEYIGTWIVQELIDTGVVELHANRSYNIPHLLDLAIDEYESEGD